MGNFISPYCSCQPVFKKHYNQCGQIKWAVFQLQPYAVNLKYFFFLAQPSILYIQNFGTRLLVMEDNSDKCPLCITSTSTTTTNLDTSLYDTWLQCDGCSTWYHAYCVNISKEQCDLIERYHCTLCIQTHGPSTCKMTHVFLFILFSLSSFSTY